MGMMVVENKVSWLIKNILRKIKRVIAKLREMYYNKKL
jgi:hypothetical protein